MFIIIFYMLIYAILPKWFDLCFISESPMQNLLAKAMLRCCQSGRNTMYQ